MSSIVQLEQPVSKSSSADASISSIKATKRKLDDAFRTLDDAVGSGDTIQDRPAKKPHISRSLYSVLAKYGIKSREPKSNTIPKPNEILAKNAPKLSAILARAASHTRKAFPFTFTAPVPSPVRVSSQTSTVEYRPSSIASFLSRLATFKLSTYANKPPAIDAVAAAKCGWVNDGKDRLVCGICNVSWVVVGREGMNRDAANILIEKQKASLVGMHKDGCPWKTKQCDDSIYCIPLRSPAIMARNIKANAETLESVMKDVEIKHPLTTSQVQALRKVLNSIPPTSSITDDTDNERQASSPRATSPQPEVSETAILTSLFGWLLVIPAPEQPRSNPFSRATSVSSSRAGTPMPTPGPPQPLIRLGTPAAKRDTSLLHCSLCRRRVGLWAFGPSAQMPVSSARGKAPTAGTNGNLAVDVPILANAPQKSPPPRRQFDLIREHRSYCPYVVRSAIVPSLPVLARSASIPNGSSVSATSVNAQNSSAIEGWRAALAVVLRHGMAWRHRVGSRDTPESGEGNEEVDGVDAMVAGVKSRGGKELLRYVKGLLA